MTITVLPQEKRTDGRVIARSQTLRDAKPEFSRDSGPDDARESARTGGYLEVVSRRGQRFVPTPGGLARRRWFINVCKLMLPAAAALLLGSIAVWPEFRHTMEQARLGYQGLRALGGGRITDAHYRGVDEHGRPYTVTAATAVQKNDDQIDLTSPDADMTLESGSWINVKSKQGVYMRKAQQLDLSGDVVLYRDDGMTMTTSTLSVEMSAGAASSAAPTHVEGPFGVLDAAGFTMVDKGTAIQFWGPSHATLNGASR
jgi:lipopolysaccharide export system protein LptC